jgi:hypothetical protein
VIPASWRKPVIDFIDVIARKPQLRGGDINADERLLCAPPVAPFVGNSDH